MRHEFTEVLNDLINYFLLADIRALRDFAAREGLSPDLAEAFTTTEAAEQAIDEGVLLPMYGVENLPYTVAFVTAPDVPALSAPGARIEHRSEAHALRVDHGSLELFTWPILEDFTESSVDALLDRYAQWAGPRIELENGWYRVDVLAGWLPREAGEVPAFEFVLTKLAERPADANVDVSTEFSLFE